VTIHIGNVSITDADKLVLPCGNYVKITVRDHGVGITTENLDKIFDPYFTTKSKGNGLGLASVHSIMKQHEGHVIVTSKLSLGTQFSLYFPAVESEVVGDPAMPVYAKKRRSSRVLVLDDDDGVRSVISSMLSLLGHEVTAVGSSGDAFAAIESSSTEARPFDAIFVDLTMPGDLSGKEVIERLRARSTASRIVVMSGYSTDPVMANYEAYGLAARLQKPFTLADVRELLD
jgi:two-component system, cell cycle sensor histidine kinase and response regulator CckA